MRTEKPETEWPIIERRIAALWRKASYAQALSELNTFLASEPTKEVARRALAYRGETHARCGEIDAARTDLGRAKRHAPNNSYERYALELRLGRICEDAGYLREARTHYLNAMRTVVRAVDLAGGTALACLLRVSRAPVLSKKEARLAESVIQRSWEVLGLPGKPEVRDLARAVTMLEEKQGHRVG